MYTTEFKFKRYGIVMNKTADKHDSGKPDYSLLPIYPIEETVKVLTDGAVKYSRDNWRKGMPWSRTYAATIRHLFAFWAGENFDPESGRHHLAHAICELLFLLEHTITFQKHDDRPEKVVGRDGKINTKT